MSTPVAVPTTRGVVVLAEDDDDLGRFMMLALEKRAGVTVHLVANGELALGALADGVVDVLVTDIQMPGMSGLQLVQQVRASHPELPIVMMTAHATVDYAIAALRSQVDEFLVKPVATADLVAKVRDLSERSVAHRLATAPAPASAPDNDGDAQRGLTDQLERAAQLQRDLLPRRIPVVPGFEFAGICAPSFAIGGDFYDWSASPEGDVRFTVADVMGKGIAAAIMTATVRAVLRGVPAQLSPGESLSTAAATLTHDLERTGTFVTVLHGRLDAARSTVRYADAGHGLSLHVAANGGYRRLAGTDLPIGILPDSTWVTRELRLEPGDTLITFSDGLFDLLGGDLETLHHIASMVATSTSCQEVVDRVSRLAANGPLPDDLTVVLIRRAGATQQPAELDVASFPTEPIIR